MKFTIVILIGLGSFLSGISYAQPYLSPNAADIYLQLRKLNVLGSALYIAAHPDDENTSLLTWFSKERLFRTGYLSITRGDGGQNLIGDEQGTELGMIRTQELMAARRMDGSEQFFSRAFDFGFSKSTEEALTIWNKEKILADVVWVIRKFQPDIIITRFPEDKRAGHGQHSASATLAREAFRAAADPLRFPQQFKFGVKPWQAKRIMWNNYNFGYAKTDSIGEVKINVGAFNPLLGKGYGEIAALSRSQHKSQGNGSSAYRGAQFDFFSHVDGSKALHLPDEDIDMSWKRIGAEKIGFMIDELVKNYLLQAPQLSVPSLINIYKEISLLPDGYWPEQKKKEIRNLLLACSGLWLEASTDRPLAVQGDSIPVNLLINNRHGQSISIQNVSILGLDTSLNTDLKQNINLNFSRMLAVPDSIPVSEPYWLEQPMSPGSFEVSDQALIGAPEAPARLRVLFSLDINGERIVAERPVMYKYTDPVKGELYQPVAVVAPVNISTEPEMILAKKNERTSKNVVVTVTANRNLKKSHALITVVSSGQTSTRSDSFSLSKGDSKRYVFQVNPESRKNIQQDSIRASVGLNDGGKTSSYDLNMHVIKYDHIPDIYYFKKDLVKLTNTDLKIAGRRIGYIEGAGDKMPDALTRMGYEVTILREKDISTERLSHFDAVITGIRAYNIHHYLSEKNEVLKTYIKNGGNLVVQYNTSMQSASSKSPIGPYPFTISRSRVTDEHAPVKFLLPAHPVFNYPNKISMDDFNGWIQERAIYFAEDLDPAFITPLAMHDPGETDQAGSLVIADYGKGKFVYTGLVFFRELPAGIPGAYRLLANIIALNKRKEIK
ncbi:MAG: PIG-L family deacetylase [Flavitalea sp.]